MSKLGQWTTSVGDSFAVAVSRPCSPKHVRFSSQGEIVIDGHDRAVQVLIGDHGNVHWLCKTVSQQFFAADDAKKLKKAMKLHVNHAMDMHRKLWPGEEPSAPPTYFREDDEGGEAADYSIITMNSKMLRSFLLHMIAYPKRKTEFRMRAFELLKTLANKLAAQGVSLQVLLFDCEGRGYWSQQRLQPGAILKPWYDEFYTNFLAVQWSEDLQSAEKPWVTSPCTHVHIADFMAFSLDFPVGLSRKFNANLRWAKQCLERCALTLATQLTKHLQNQVRSISKPTAERTFAKRRTKGQRLLKHEKWQVVAAAMTSILQREESRPQLDRVPGSMAAMNMTFHLSYFAPSILPL